MKDKKLYVKKQSNGSVLSIKKILFYFSLFFQINHLLNQSNTHKKFSPLQSPKSENNPSSFSTVLTSNQEVILPLLLYALMPENKIVTPIAAYMMFSISNLPTTQASSFKRLWKDLTRGSFGGGTFNNAQQTLDKANEVGKSIAQNFGHEARITMQENGKVLEGIIEKIDNSANNFVINFSNQGRLLIENFGKEIRFTADDVLKKASQHGEFLLSVAGKKASFAIQETGHEARLVIHDAGDEIRSVISHATQEAMIFVDGLPDIGSTIEKAITHTMYGIYKIFFYLNDYQNAVIKIGDALHDKKTFDLIQTLNYIKSMNKLSSYQRMQLYTRLLLAFAVPNDDVRIKTLLYIGAVAMVDEGLIETINLGFITYQKDYYETILASMPDVSVKAILEKEDEQQFFMKLGLPLPQPKTTEVGLLSFSLTDDVPSDYVECDGAEYPVNDMPELYKSIGRAYGHAYINGQDYFKVPDLRNYFLRMASPTNKVGTFQEDATRIPSNVKIEESGEHIHPICPNGDHKHELYGVMYGDDNGAHFTWLNDHKGTQWNNYETKSSGGHDHKMQPAGGHGHSLSGGDNETRPKNMAVKCLIKYRSTCLKNEQLEDKVNTLNNTVQNQSQNLQIMSFFAGAATTAAVAASAALLFRR